VGNISYNDGNIEVEKHLLLDVAASQMSAVIELLDTYHLSVLFYNGNLDIIVKHCNVISCQSHFHIAKNILAVWRSSDNPLDRCDAMERERCNGVS
jgi:hypothetical protein